MGLFNRSVGASVLLLFAVAACDGVSTATSVALGFLAGPEFRDEYPLGNLSRRRKRVEKAFWTLLGRESGASLDSFAAMATTEAGWDSVLSIFVTSPEFSWRVNAGGANAYDGQIC